MFKYFIISHWKTSVFEGHTKVKGLQLNFSGNLNAYSVSFSYNPYK